MSAKFEQRFIARHEVVRVYGDAQVKQVIVLRVGELSLPFDDWDESGKPGEQLKNLGDPCRLQIFFQLGIARHPQQLGE